MSSLKNILPSLPLCFLGVAFAGAVAAQDLSLADECIIEDIKTSFHDHVNSYMAGGSSGFVFNHPESVQVLTQMCEEKTGVNATEATEKLRQEGAAIFVGSALDLDSL